jgi:CATRA-associated small protein
MPGRPDEIERELRDLVSRALEPERWSEVNRALAALAVALAEGDEAAVRRQRTAIDRLGSRRISRGVNPAMGTPDPRPAGPDTVDLVNHIVERLVPAPREPAADPSASEPSPGSAEQTQ